MNARTIKSIKTLININMKRFSTILPVLFFSIIILVSCKKKEDEKFPPAINFKSGETYTKDNDTVMVGYRLSFGIQARGTSEKITNLSIKKILENGTVVTMFDTGMYAESLDLNKVFYQNVESKATWVFTVMDRNRMSSEIRRVVYKDLNSQFGGINYYPSIKLGYQNNTTYPHFLNPYTGIVYPTDSANQFFSEIDILCYYILSDGTPSPVLSSPGEMDNSSTEAQTFYPYIASWSTRRYTLWDISVDDTPVSTSDFNAAQNDSLLIVAYHDVWGKKKFRWATSGKIIPFITASGKKGLIHVVNAETFDTGIMEIAVKIQQ